MTGVIWALAIAVVTVGLIAALLGLCCFIHGTLMRARLERCGRRFDKDRRGK